MIFWDCNVMTPSGLREARFLKPGDAVMSWNGRHWVENRIGKIEHGRARTALVFASYDGIVPMIVRCTGDEKFRIPKSRYREASHLDAGAIVMVSEGSNLFSVETTVVEMMDLPQPEDTVAIKMRDDPKNYLAGGFLCRG